MLLGSWAPWHQAESGTCRQNQVFHADEARALNFRHSQARKDTLGHFGEERSLSSPSSPEFCGTFGRMVLQKVFRSTKPVEPNCLQKPKGSAELWEPSPTFQTIQILLPTFRAVISHDPPYLGNENSAQCFSD